MASQTSVPDAQTMEREYVAHRRSVLAMLRSDFAGVPDHEELYQEAWTEALELQARGEEIANLGGLLRTIAWRRARDRLRKQKPDTIDPSSFLMLSQSDPGASPAEQVEVQVDAAVIKQVVASLEPRQAAVIKLRFEQHLDAKEIQRQLGVSPKRLEKIVTEAYQQVERALVEGEGGGTPWSRRQRSLLVACETGLASARQRRLAAQMVRDDPACRAMLAEIRATLDRVAAIVPFPLLAPESTERLVGRIRALLSDRLHAVRDQAADLLSRSGHGVEQASAGGAASITGGLAAKAALVCVTVSGGTVVCLTTGIIDTGPAPPAPKKAVPTAPRQIERNPDRVVAALPAPSKPKATPRIETEATPRSTAPAAPPPPSPAPAESTEFGPGTTGSTAASNVPAAAPASAGGEFLP